MPHCPLAKLIIEFNVKPKNKSMKKNDTRSSSSREKLWRKLLLVKFLCLCMLVQNLAFSAVYSQEVKLTLKAENKNLTDILTEIRENSRYTFVYNLDDLQGIRVKSLDVKDATLEEVLDKCLEGTGFSYEIEDDVVIIRPERPARDEVKKVVVKGVVMTTDSVPIPGATVILRGTYAGVISDINGKFEMAIPARKDIVLLVSFVGMETREVKVSDVTKTLTVVMKEKVDQLDEVVVTGYGQTTKRNSPGSFGTVAAEVFENKAIPTVDMLLQGQIAGVSVVAVSGRPGEAAKIRIRGTNTISGDAEPLWVVDGVPLQQDIPEISTGQIKSGNLNEIFVTGVAGINPNDIESVTILKDASAAAIYGSRAAGGVIVVTTKKGKAGKMKVNYSATFSVGLKPQRDPKLMNSREKLAWERELWDEFSAAPFEHNKTEKPLKHYPVVGIVGMLRAEKLGRDDKLWLEDGFEPMSTAEQDAYIEELGKRTTNWFDVIFRNSFSMNHNLSFSGGSDRNTYYVSLGVADQNGLVKETDYERYNVNAKINTNATERLNMMFGIDLSKQKSKSYSTVINPFEYAYFANPYEKVYNEDGSYRPDRTYFNLQSINEGNANIVILPTNGFNIMRELKETSSTADNANARVQMNLTYDLLSYLRFSGLASYTYFHNKVEDTRGRDTYAAFLDRLYFDEYNDEWTPYGTITQTSTNGSSYNVRGQLEYKNTFALEHYLSLVGGAELRGDKNQRTYFKRFGYDEVTGYSAMPLPPEPSVTDVGKYADLFDQLAGETTTENRFASFYASLDYNYLQRYLFSFTFRTDGSNNFGSDEQFNPTWSLGLGWHLDRERFMSSLLPVVNRLSLRASMGYTGNIVKSVNKELVLRYTTTYWNGLRTGSVSSAPNPNVRWEKTKDMKVALDFGLFDERVSGLVEAYYRVSSDVVSTVDVLSSTGFSGQPYNTSEIKNKGVEGTLNVKVLNGKDFKLDVGGNIAWNRNILSKYSRKRVIGNGRYEGFPLESVFAGRYIKIDERDGVYTFELRPDAQIYTGTDLQSKDNYRFYLGTSVAPVTGGFNVNFSYRGLRLNVGGVVSSGAKILNTVTSPAGYRSVTSLATGEKPQTTYSDLYRNHLNVEKSVTNRWTEERRTGVKYPRIIDYLAEERLLLDQYNVHDTEITQGAYLENVSFLRVKNISLYYNLPERLLHPLGLKSVVFSFTMNNFITFTNYSGIDPETPGTTYPLTRSVTFGLNVGF